MSDAGTGGFDGPLGPVFGQSTGGPDLPAVQGGGLGFTPPPRHHCADTPALILRALEGVPDASVIEAVRSSLAPCPPCVDAFEVEIRFKIAMAQHTMQKAPRSLQLRISETLQRVDLGEIDVTDL